MDFSKRDLTIFGIAIFGHRKRKVSMFGISGFARGGGSSRLVARPPDCRAGTGQNYQHQLSPKMSDQPSVKIVTYTNGGITFAQVKERGVEVKGVTFHRFEEEV